jgi:formylmethanofuran dehydrogenase subunit E
VEEEFDNKRVAKLLKDFGVKNEEELYKELMQPIITIPCSECGRETEIESIHTIDGDPVCSSCLWDKQNE